MLFLQKCGFSLEPSQGISMEATFTPDGKYVLSGNNAFVQMTLDYILS